MAYIRSRYMFAVFLSLCLYRGAHFAVIQVIPDPEVTLTCWSCPEHPDNEACNNWAPDIICPLHRTWCMSVNRVDMVTGRSVAVYKRCAEDQECNLDNIGCYESTISGILECKTCCNEDYCNEPVPYNSTSALALSSYYSNTSASATYHTSLLLVIVCVVCLVYMDSVMASINGLVSTVALSISMETLDVTNVTCPTSASNTRMTLGVTHRLFGAVSL